MADVLVASDRMPRWVGNFEARHGAAALAVIEGGLSGTAADGSFFEARLPFDASYVGAADPVAFAAAAAPPDRWGVLLVRKGGFAVALLAGDRLVSHKVGQRHVQGRTKAGGQSQQRFARRREHQARVAFEAAADHAARVLDAGSRTDPLPVVLGGDRAAVGEVLRDVRLAHLVPVDGFLPLPDPHRRELDAAVAQAQGLRIIVTNAP